MAVLYQSSLPAGDNPAARETVRVMARFARRWSRDAVVLRLARQMSSAADAFYWVSNRVRFVADPVDVELLRSPGRLLVEGGDCDDKATLLAALLIAQGVRVRFRLVCADRGQPGRLSHVYVLALLDGAWVPLDPTYPGTPYGVAPHPGNGCAEVFPV